MRARQQWRLDPSEAQVHSSGKTVGQRTSATKNSRAETATSFTFKLTHGPTGLKAEGCVPSGRYTRKQMQVLKQDLLRALMKQLEHDVAKRLRIPGR